jgi:hypothetical protein
LHCLFIYLFIFFLFLLFISLAFLRINSYSLFGFWRSNDGKYQMTRRETFKKFHQLLLTFVALINIPQSASFLLSKKRTLRTKRGTTTFSSVIIPRKRLTTFAGSILLPPVLRAESSACLRTSTYRLGANRHLHLARLHV